MYFKHENYLQPSKMPPKPLGDFVDVFVRGRNKSEDMTCTKM